MTNSTIALIVTIVIAALLLLATIAWVVRNKRNQCRHAEADTIRQAATEETRQVKQREALADETAARARAAQAEADVLAAQAAGLQEQAASHRSAAANSRDRVDEQWDRADKIDPATAETPKTVASAEHPNR